MAASVVSAARRSATVSNSGSDVDGARHATRVDIDADETDLLQQDRDLEHVADRLGHRDHVVGHDAFAEATVCRRRLAEHGEFAGRDVGVRRRAA